MQGLAGHISNIFCNFSRIFFLKVKKSNGFASTEHFTSVSFDMAAPFHDDDNNNFQSASRVNASGSMFMLVFLLVHAEGSRCLE